MNTSSTCGLHGVACALVFAAGEIAVPGPTKSAAPGTAGLGISLNAAVPGTTHTGMLRPRVGNTDAIKTAADLLALVRSSFTTGRILSVDGGKSAA